MIFPADSQLITLGTKVCSILLGSRLAIDIRQRHSCSQHVLGVTDEEVGVYRQAVPEESEVKAQVLGDDRLPGQTAGYRSICISITGVGEAVEGISAEQTGLKFFPVVVIVHLLVAEGTVTDADLGIADIRFDRGPERLFAQAPSGGC